MSLEHLVGLKPPVPFLAVSLSCGITCCAICVFFSSAYCFDESSTAQHQIFAPTECRPRENSVCTSPLPSLLNPPPPTKPQTSARNKCMQSRGRDHIRRQARLCRGRGAGHLRRVGQTTSIGWRRRGRCSPDARNTQARVPAAAETFVGALT